MERAVSATYTVMFTDLVDSTAQRSRLGDDAADELHKRHHGILREAVESHRGEVVNTTGDGIMAAFLGAADGIACAVAVQQAIHEWNEISDERFGVRVGLSLGDARFEDDDLHGTPVVEAARLCAKATGGEILCAEVVRVVAGSRVTQRFTAGRCARAEGPARAASPRCVSSGSRAVDVERGGLPFPAGLEPTGRYPFVGRHPELDTLLGLWRNAVDGRRSVVLVSGEPGIGKTRLSSELARRAHTPGLDRDLRALRRRARRAVPAVRRGAGVRRRQLRAQGLHAGARPPRGRAHPARAAARRARARPRGRRSPPIRRRRSTACSKRWPTRWWRRRRCSRSSS